jgi:hypothetical protein
VLAASVPGLKILAMPTTAADLKKSLLFIMI